MKVISGENISALEWQSKKLSSEWQQIQIPAINDQENKIHSSSCQS